MIRINKITKMEDISRGKATRKRIMNVKLKHDKELKKGRLDELRGYPYDVSTVTFSDIKGCNYWNFKLHVGPDLYVECVSVGYILDKQAMVQRCESNKQCIEIQNYIRDEQGVVFLKKDSLFKTLPSPGYEFKRKVFSLEECDSLHYGHVVDVRAKVICAAEPVTLETRFGTRLTVQSVLLADESSHMWFDIWETPERNLKELSRKESCHYITKCQTGMLFDVKFLKTTPETTFKTSNYINHQEIAVKKLKLIKKSHVSQIIGKIMSCSPKKIQPVHKCPSCKEEVEATEINGTKFTCENCETCGLASALENVFSAAVKMKPVDGGKECTIHLCSLVYPGDNCLGKVLEANMGDSDVDIKRLQNKQIAKNLISDSRVWKVRKTPEGNVINIEEID